MIKFKFLIVLFIVFSNLSHAQTPESLITSGKKKREANVYSEAIADFSKAIELNKKLEEAYYQRGEVYYLLARHSEALNDFNKTIELEPTQGMNYYHRGLVHLALDNHQMALYDFNKTLDIIPNYELAYIARAKVSANLKRYSQAIKDCNQALDLNSELPAAISLRGMIYLAQLKWEEAYRDLNAAVQMRPNQADLRLNLAEYYKAKGQNEKAVEEYTSVIRLEPQNAPAYFQRACLKLTMGNNTDAQKDANKAIYNQRRFLLAHAIRMVASYNLATTNTSTAYHQFEYDYNFFMRNAKSTEEFNFAASQLYKYAKDNNTILQAEECAQKAVQIDDNYDNNFLLANILFKAKKTSSARDFAEKAVNLARKSRIDIGSAQYLVGKIDKESLDKIPPVIRITAPISSNRGIITVEASEKVTVIGNVTDESGISKVLINGNPARISAEGTFDGETLLNGKNDETIITIRAYDNLGNMSTKSFNVKRTQPVANTNTTQSKTQLIGKSRAILFATNDYDFWGPLVNPVMDARAIAKDLQDIYGFEVELLENLNKEDMMLKLKSYAKKQYENNDQLFIFFAGHGQFDEIFKEGYVVAKDTKYEDEAKSSYIAHANLRTYINSIPCKHTFLVMDVCFGGTFDQLVAMRGQSDFNSDREELINRKLRYTTRKYLTSGGKEYVPDGKAGQHSPFARKFLEALRSEGGKDRVLTVGEIMEYFNGIKPAPHAGEFGNNEPGSDFLFIAK